MSKENKPDSTDVVDDTFLVASIVTVVTVVTVFIIFSVCSYIVVLSLDK